ncbi:MAG: hypothetical protein BMS9Abin37_3056 [Acidobacteriota bacterium]|nr:MAG: hypothetical protein BMS9Abin37_3056 [Acidobacteriota bacterium]
MTHRRRIVLKSLGLSLLVPWALRREDGGDVLVGDEELDRVITGSFHHRPPPSGSDFTVTSWNIEYGRRYGLVADSMESVLSSDIFLLQEVDRMTNRTRDKAAQSLRDLPLLFAERLGMHYAYGLEFQELKQDEPGRPAFTGQQTLSVFPLSHPETVRFKNQLADWSRGWLGLWEKRHGGRMFLYCQAQINGVVVHIYNTHLESRANDERKLAQVAEMLEHLSMNASRSEPVIVAGDLNTRESEHSPIVTRFLDDGFEDGVLERSPGRNATNRKGDRRLDWLFSRNLEPTSARLAPGLLGSDHRAVSVTYRAPRTR